MSTEAIPPNVAEARTLRDAATWTPTFANIPAMLSDRASRYADKQWLSYVDDSGEVLRRWTYEETREFVARAATVLSRRGVGAGDRVAVLAGNLDYTVLFYLATWSLGACVAPINAGESAERKAFILENSEARVLLCRTAFLEDGRALASEFGADLIVLDGDSDGDPEDSEPSALALVREAAPLDLDDATFDAKGTEALLIYTSGTTGPPKGVRVDQFNMMVDAASMAEWHGWDDSLRMMCVLPIHHVNGIIVTHITPLFCGGTTLLNSRFKSDTFWPNIVSEKVQVVSVVPTLLEFLNEQAVADGGPDEAATRARDTMQAILCGAGPLLVETAMRFERTFEVPIIHGYGLSETTCYNCHLPPELGDDERRRWLSESGFPSIGVPLPHQEMAILSPDGSELDADERGEICIRGDAISLGYYNRPEANAKSFQNGWFRSGDEGFWQEGEDGRRYFFITGRLKELIIRGGVNYAPLEIDEVLNSIDGVRYGLAVPFPNKYYGDEIAAYVVPGPGGVEASDILNACVDELGFSKSPKLVVFGDEVPYTTTGKPRRIALARSLEEPLKEYRGHQFRRGDIERALLLDLREPAE